MATYSFTTNEVLKKDKINLYAANSGLVFVKQSTATSGSSLSIDNCFTTDYDNYHISVSNFKTSGNATVTLKLRTGSGDDSTTNYWYSGLGVNYTGTATTTIYSVASQTTGKTSWQMPSSGGIYGGYTFTIFDPFRSTASTGYAVNAAGTNTTMEAYSGFHDTLTSFTGMSLILSTGTFTNIKVTIYGYRKA